MGHLPFLYFGLLNDPFFSEIISRFLNVIFECLFPTLFYLSLLFKSYKGKHMRV